MDSVKTTKEALRLGMEILREDSHDHMDVRYFVLDLLFEIEDYEQAIKVLWLYPDEWSTE